MPDTIANEMRKPTDQLVEAGTLIARNITVGKHRTSIRLEAEMWSALNDICKRENVSLGEICTAIAGIKQAASSLTAAIRVFIAVYYRDASTEAGHNDAGHGSRNGIFGNGHPRLSFSNRAGRVSEDMQNIAKEISGVDREELHYEENPDTLQRVISE